MKLTLSAVLFLLFLPTSYSQETAEVIENTIHHMIDSKAFGEERKITVFLPARYLRSPKDSMIVTYVLDAQYDQFFNMATGNMDYLVDSYGIVPSIVVGIHTKKRMAEFTPPAKDSTIKEDYGDNAGKAGLLQRHLKEEVFPLIKKNYRTKDYKVILGHSRGGSFVIHTLFSDASDMFNAYVGLSPALDFDNEQALKDAAALLQTDKKYNAYLYCSSGDVGYREVLFDSEVRRLDSIIQKYPNATLGWGSEKLWGKDHWTAVIPTVNNAMISVTRQIMVDQKMVKDFSKHKDKTILEQVEAFYKKAQATYGFVEIPSSGYIRYVGDNFYNIDDFEHALEIYNWGLKAYPNSLGLHRDAGEAQEKLGLADDAKQSFKKALALLEINKADYSQEDYDRVKGKLNKKIASGK